MTPFGARAQLALQRGSPTPFCAANAREHCKLTTGDRRARPHQSESGQSIDWRHDEQVVHLVVLHAWPRAERRRQQEGVFGGS